MSATKRAREMATPEAAQKLLDSGAYIPPFRLARLQAAQPAGTDNVAAQRLAWEALRVRELLFDRSPVLSRSHALREQKSINGIINKVNASNLAQLAPALFRENLVRGRGLLCRALVTAQAASPAFSDVYAAVVAVVNSKLPAVGELMVTRLAASFDRSVCAGV